MIQDVFGTTGAVEWWQEVARALLILLYGLVLVRTLGRRVFGKWSAIDIVVSVIVGSNLSRALTGNAALFGTLAATTALLLAHWLLAQAAARSDRISAIVEGRPTWIARDGVLDDRLRRIRAVSHADLSEALRRAGVDRVEETSQVVLEPNGTIIANKR